MARKLVSNSCSGFQIEHEERLVQQGIQWSAVKSGTTPAHVLWEATHPRRPIRPSPVSRPASVGSSPVGRLCWSPPSSAVSYPLHGSRSAHFSTSLESELGAEEGEAVLEDVALAGHSDGPAPTPRPTLSDALQQQFDLEAQAQAVRVRPASTGTTQAPAPVTAVLRMRLFMVFRDSAQTDVCWLAVTTDTVQLLNIDTQATISSWRLETVHSWFRAGQQVKLLLPSANLTVTVFTPEAAAVVEALETAARERRRLAMAGGASPPGSTRYGTSGMMPFPFP